MADTVNVCRFGPGFLPRLLDHLRSELPDSCGAGMTVLSTGAPPRVASANGSAEVLDELQWDLREGPLVEAQQTERVVRATPLLDEAKWPRFSEAARESAPGVTGGLFVPGTWDQAGPVLLSVYLSAPPDADTLRQVERLEPLLATALGMAEFCAGENLRAESMLIMMQYRRVIEQAKGAIMVTLGCNADTAFETLVRSSQHFGVRLRELAVAVAERVSGGPADVPSDHEHELVITDRDREAAEQMWSAIAHRGVLPISLRRGKAPGNDPGSAPKKASAKSTAKSTAKAPAKTSAKSPAKKNGPGKTAAKTAAKSVGKHTTKAPAKSGAAKSPAGATPTASKDRPAAKTGS